MKTIDDFREGHKSGKHKVGQDWELAIESFLNHCKAKNLRPRTIEWYQEHIELYFYRDFVVNAKIESPDDFNTEDLQRYIVYMHNRKLQISSANIRLRAIRTFFNYLREMGYIDGKVKVKLLKQDKTIIKTFSQEQVAKLVKRPAKVEDLSFAQYRDYVMINFLLGTGVRLATFKVIKIEDVDFIQNEIRLQHTKNREQYIIPLSLSLGRILQEYLKIRNGEPEDYLFCNSYGEALKERTIQDRIKFYCQERLGKEAFSYRCSPHDFRHTFAVMYIRNGGDLLSLQKLLGHNTLEMTRRYVNLLNDDIKSKFAEFSPLDSVISFKQTGRKAIRVKK